MPRLDGTGPKGQGPKTGRGLGNCDPKENTDITKQNLNAKDIGLGVGRKVRANRRINPNNRGSN